MCRKGVTEKGKEGRTGGRRTGNMARKTVSAKISSRKMKYKPDNPKAVIPLILLGAFVPVHTTSVRLSI